MLATALFLDIVAYSRDDTATITATTRDYLAGVRKTANVLLSAMVGAIVVGVTGWYERPPDDAYGLLVWWACSVTMFVSMFTFALDLWLYHRRRGILPVALRQINFGYAIGGLVAHFAL